MFSKVTKWTALLLLFGLFSQQAADASTLAAKGTWQRKLQRGFLNTAFSPLEISNELAQEKKGGQAFLGWFKGLGEGSWFAVLRALSGIYDIVTFPVPLPSNYEPVYRPEFALEYLGLLKEGS